MSNTNNPNASQRQSDVSWDNWGGKCNQPEATQSRPVGINPHHGGDKVTKSQLRAEGQKIIDGAKNVPGIGQPSDQELFGHLVQKESDLKKMDDDWNNFFNGTLNEARKPVDEIVKAQLPAELQKEWVDGTSYNDMLSEEERLERSKYVGQ